MRNSSCAGIVHNICVSIARANEAKRIEADWFGEECAGGVVDSELKGFCVLERQGNSP
jgi:hypothetical protein